jgi:transcription elongation factor GreA
MNMEKEYLTKSKHDALVVELEHLKTIRRKEVAEDLEYAKSLGDLSENQEYQEARNAQAVLEDRISRIENILKHSSIVSTHGGGRVTVGSTITIKREDDETKRIYIIVGSEEADATSGKISLRSPLGVAVLGKVKGETFSFETPSGIMFYKIIDIK